MLNFIASLGRMIGINIAGFLYNNGEGFRQGTIFYIVITMLLGSATIMWFTSKYEKKTTTTAEKTAVTTLPENSAASSGDRGTYKWFLTSLVIIIVGASSVNQIFLIFLQDVLKMGSPEVASILTAWTFAGMLTSLLCGWLADRIGRATMLIMGLVLAIVTPLFYGSASNVLGMALIYGINGVSFWTIQTVGFAFVGDIIPEDQRGRLFSRYNAVMALSWGPAGLLVGGPLADLQVRSLGLSSYTAFVNTFYTSSIIVAIGTLLFAVKVARLKAKTN
jgi:MFS family permease